jgi:hypothetical protein
MWQGPSSCQALTSIPGEGRTNRGSEPVAAAELSADKLAVFPESPAQRGDLDLQVLLRDNNAWPHTTHKVVFADQRSIGLQQDQEKIEGARPQLYRHAVGHQLSPAQQNAETTEFKHRVGCCRARPVGAMRRWVLAVEGEPGVAPRGHRGTLRLVYSLQFGAALGAGRVNGCEDVQELPLQLFAGTGFAPEGRGSLLSRCKIFPGLYELGRTSGRFPDG